MVRCGARREVQGRCVRDESRSEGHEMAGERLLIRRHPSGDWPCLYLGSVLIKGHLSSRDGVVRFERLQARTYRLNSAIGERGRTV